MIRVEKNVGGADRTVPVALKLVIVGAMIMTIAFGDPFGNPTQGLVAAVLLLVAFILLGTAGDEKSSLNRALGQNTYNERDSESR